MINGKEQVQWFLEGELRDNSPWIIPIHSDTFLIGRLDSSDLILTSSSVSRKHAELKISNDDLFITDLKSKNGTLVNGKNQKEKTLLHNGDLLKIGISEFKIFTKVTYREENSSRTEIGFSDNSEKSFAEFYNLSERESEVLYFLLKGLSLKVIGEKLFISAGTVKNHVLKIYKKTDSHSRIELSTRYSEFSEKV